jgi:hypothetical protein
MCFGMIGLSLLLTSCVTRRNLEKSGDLKMRLSQNREVKLWGSAWEENGALTVAGSVRPRRPGEGVDAGHLHITIRERSGNEFAAKLVKLRRIEARKRVPDFIKFSTPFASIPPKHSTIRLKWHAGSDCSQ